MTIDLLIQLQYTSDRSFIFCGTDTNMQDTHPISASEPQPFDNTGLFPRSEIEQSIVSRFHSQVALHRDRIAIRSPNYVWTYGQLANVVNQFAELIQSRFGAGDGRIALLFPHDAPMCAAMLAVLQTGRTYVPLDPAYPAARLQMIYQDSAPDALFADAQCIDLAHDMLADRSGLLITNTQELDPDRQITRDWPEISPGALAYLLYTSGSTGRPKGVIQCHRNVLHFICEYTRNLGITQNDTLTLLSSYAFDAAVMAIYGALLNGATLCPLSVKTTGFAAIGPWLNNEKITIYHSTPTVYRAFLRAQPAAMRFKTVRLVVLGGEAVSRSDLEMFNQRFNPATILINGLGPTESTVTLQNFIRHGQPLPDGPVSVGTPVGHTDVLLLDEHGAMAEDAGELALCSDHLAVGYWRRPDQDAKAFHSHPLDMARRLYRTGDLARRGPGGEFYYLGRKDLQVKINGVRIELEEIEYAVERLPGIRQCVASALKDAADQTILVAYVLPLQKDYPVDTLRDSLRATLPDTLIPHRFVLVTELPLTPTNKVDRKALEALHPVVLPSSISAPLFEPEDNVEATVMMLWHDILGAPPSDRSADFYAAGADSLKTMRLADGIEQSLEWRVDLGRLFSARTFSEITAAVRKDQAQGDGIGDIVALTRHAGNGGERLYCICGIQLYRGLAEAIGSPVETSGVFLRIEAGFLRGEPVPPLETLAAMYRDAILAEQPSGAIRLAGVSFGGMLAYEIARQLRAANREVAYLGIFDTALPQTIGTVSRLAAHSRLLLKHGPNHFLKRFAKEANHNSDDDMPAPERGDIYSASLDSYRKSMPSYDGDAYFYRASDRGEFEKLGTPLDYNWGRYVKGTLTVREVAGGHVSLLGRPYVTGLGQTVRADMGFDG